MTRTFTFNRLVAALLLLPLLVLLALSLLAVVMDFSVVKLLACLVTALAFLAFTWLSLLRRITLGPDKAVWRTPTTRIELPLAEVKSWGKVRYRSYTFLFLSRLEGNPFQEQPLAPSPDTLILQDRPRAFSLLTDLMAKAHPHLQGQQLSKQG